MRKNALTKCLTVGAMVLSIGSAVAQVLSTIPTSPTSPTPTTPTPPSYPAEATTCPLPRKLHQKPKSFQNWTGLYQDRVVLKLKDDLPLAPMWTAKGPAFKELTSGVVSAAELEALNAILLGTERGIARQHASVPLDTLAKWRSAGQARSCEALADLSQYYRLYLAKGEKLETVVNALNASSLVEVAFAPPIPRGALDVAPTTPDFQGRQDYLDPAVAGGIGARDAWRLEGARGAGLRVIDVEATWNVNHEDLPKPFWSATIPTLNEIATALQAPLMSINADVHHGTAVVGELVAFNDKSGVTGIASDAEWGASSVIRILPVFNNNNLFAGPFGGTHEAVVADAILEAQDHVRRGDAILIEQHSPGPQSCPFPQDCGQAGYVAMEYWADVFDAIKQATALGTIVVEAAGNGNADLDNAVYEGRFDRRLRDSGAILVGATSGQLFSSGAQLGPNPSSNSSLRLDVSAWGANVMTTGYGTSRSPSGIEVNGPNDPNQFYTPAFGGTSSASPMVTAAALSVQGVLISSEHGILTPRQMRDLLTRTGQPQVLSPFSRPIGPLLNLDGALDSLVTATAAAGGMGGSEFTLNCPGGLALIGIKGKAGALIDRVQAICGTIDGAVQTTTFAGGSGGTDFERKCPLGKVVVGLGGRAGAFVDSLDVQCDFPPDGTRRVVEVLPRAGGPFGAVFGPVFCPNDRVAVGLQGRAAAFVDRIQLQCAVYDPTPPPSWLSQTVGGTGGSYVNLRCSGDEVLVGVRARGNAVVDRLQARCVRVDASGAWTSSIVTRGSVGGTGGTEKTIDCPNGSAVSGISGRAAAVIDRLAVYCRDLSGPQQLTGASSFADSIGGTGGASFGRIDCPYGYPAQGFAAWGGGFVDRLRLACGRDP
jgi:hypothetical protein